MLPPAFTVIILAAHVDVAKIIGAEVITICEELVATVAGSPDGAAAPALGVESIANPMASNKIVTATIIYLRLLCVVVFILF